MFVYLYEEFVKILMDNYLDNVEVYCNKNKFCDLLIGEELNSDDKLMCLIEE